jgi:hypothetical protein
VGFSGQGSDAWGIVHVMLPMQKGTPMQRCKLSPDNKPVPCTDYEYSDWFDSLKDYESCTFGKIVAHDQIGRYQVITLFFAFAPKAASREEGTPQHFLTQVIGPDGFIELKPNARFTDAIAEHESRVADPCKRTKKNLDTKLKKRRKAEADSKAKAIEQAAASVEAAKEELEELAA